MAQPNCKKYFDLTPIEKISFIGELVHAVQSNDRLFDLAKDLIALGFNIGVFENTVINPPTEESS